MKFILNDRLAGTVYVVQYLKGQGIPLFRPVLAKLRAREVFTAAPFLSAGVKHFEDGFGSPEDVNNGGRLLEQLVELLLRLLPDLVDPDMVADAYDQLFCRKRFDEIVVGAGVETFPPCFFSCPCR